MALEVGNKISKELVKYISDLTEMKELYKIADKHNMSGELARTLAKGEKPITEKNMPLIEEILKLAISNRKKFLFRINKTHSKALKTIK